MKSLRHFVLIGAALLAWEITARSGLWSPLLFPSLVSIGRELGRFIFSEQVMEAWTSLYRALGGFGLAAVAGVLAGIVMGRSAFVAALLDPLFSGTYAVPKLALFPIFIFAFGIGSLSKVALIFLECLYPMVIITEMVSSADGLGYQVIYALSSLKTDRMLALVAVIALLGWALDKALVMLRDRLVYWEKLETYYV